MNDESLTIFAGSRAVATGTRDTLAAVLRELHAGGEPAVLVFDDATGQQIDSDWRDHPPARKPARPGPGRPKLGVAAREVTLLPRHWEWLDTQPGGASVTLRKLVETARRDSAVSDRRRRSQEAAFRFMTAVAGNEAGYEEALRALFASDRQQFESWIAQWPSDVAGYSRRLAAEAFDPGR
jgi:hypothetical protein